MLNWILLIGSAAVGVGAKTGALTKVGHAMSHTGHAVVHTIHHKKKPKGGDAPEPN